VRELEGGCQVPRAPVCPAAAAAVGHEPDSDRSAGEKCNGSCFDLRIGEEEGAREVGGNTGRVWQESWRRRSSATDPWGGRAATLHWPLVCALMCAQPPCICCCSMGPNDEARQLTGPHDTARQLNPTQEL
jgi:hypothetical protein